MNSSYKEQYTKGESKKTNIKVVKQTEEWLNITRKKKEKFKTYVQILVIIHNVQREKKHKRQKEGYEIKS